MTTFRKGDKVRLDVEGVVVTSDKHGTQVRLSGREAVGNGGDNYFFDDSLLTVVKKSFHPGDIVATEEDYNDLPVGSLIRIAHDPGYVKLGTGEFAWIPTGSKYNLAAYSDARTVFYVPE